VPPTPRLYISATNFEGLPLENILFGIVDPTHGNHEVATNANGEAEVPAPWAASESATIQLRDPRYLATRPRDIITGLTTTQVWRLFSAEWDHMNPEERQALAAAYGDLLPPTAPPASDGSAPPVSLRQAPVVLLLAQFLGGRERPSQFPTLKIPEEGEDEPEHEGALSVRLIDGRGAPIRGALVQLYVGSLATTEVALLDYERTNEDGIALFMGLEPGLFYRAEVVEDGDQGARSTILQLPPEGGPVTLPTMVLRARGEMLSGIVVDAEGPAGGTLVTARRGSDGLLMTAATDAAGYFLLAPFSAGDEVTLTFEQSIAGGVRTGFLTARPGGPEMFIPLHILTAAN
jgi:hypothetical protein